MNNQTNNTRIAFRPNLILLIGGQMVPNLESYRWLRNDKKKLRVLILHTNDRPFQKGAFRLRDYVVKCNDEARCETVGIGPNDVSEMIGRYVPEDGVDYRVIMNCTGALKPMSVGMMEWTGIRGVEVIYRETNGHWSEVIKNEEGWFELKDLKEPPTLGLLEEISIPDLAGLQHPLGEADWRLEDEKTMDDWLLDQSGVELVLEKHLQEDLLFVPAFEEVIGTKVLKTGDALEYFVLSLIRLLGLRQSGLSLTLSNPDDAGLGSEIDVVGIHQGNFFLIDCKLVTDSQKKGSLSEQAYQARHQAEAIGGRQARVLMLRPGFQPDAKIAQFQKKLVEAVRVTVLFQEDMKDLVGKLSQFLGVATVPPVMGQVVERMRSSVGAIFASPDRIGMSRLSEPPISNYFDGVLEATEWLKGELKREWCAIEIEESVMIVAKVRGRSREEVGKVINKQVSCACILKPLAKSIGDKWHQGIYRFEIPRAVFQGIRKRFQS